MRLTLGTTKLSWMLIATALERIAGLVQSILVARALGITDYGVYGLVFSTVGLAASLAGMQMGLTATVFVARYRESDRAKAVFVMRHVTRFGLGIAALLLGAAVAFAGPISDWLLGSRAHVAAVVAGGLIAALSITGGIQEGVVQGLEDFRSIALWRLWTTAMTATAIYPAGLFFGLSGVLFTVVAVQAVKYAGLHRALRVRTVDAGFPARGGGLSARDLLIGFSIPSVLVSALFGVVNWGGSLALSRLASGFESLAVVTTGMQWRGPILFIASTIGTVAIPAISRHLGREDHGAIRKMHREMLLLTGGIASAMGLGVTFLSPVILSFYGPGFASGAREFSLLVLSAIPQVVAGVYLQHLVARGQAWRQLLLHLWLVVPLAAGYLLLVPGMGALGLAVATLSAWTVFAIALMVLQGRRSHMPASAGAQFAEGVQSE